MNQIIVKSFLSLIFLSGLLLILDIYQGKQSDQQVNFTQEISVSDNFRTYFVGLNQAIDINNGTGGLQAQLDLASQYDMKYILGMIISPSAKEYVVDFINQTLEREMIPIVRLCYATVQGCDPSFKDPSEIHDFYREVVAEADGPFIAMIGPNEPGTGAIGNVDEDGRRKEIFGFVDESLTMPQAYDKIVEQTNNIAQQLQDLRDQGKIYLSPGSFNLTNTQNDDTKEYLYSRSLDLSLFDFLMGNTYELNNRLSYDYYVNGADGSGTYSLKNIVEEQSTELKTIITEFGILMVPSANRAQQINSAIESMNNFCMDTSVESVLFFRALEGLPETMDIHKISFDELTSILESCNIRVVQPPEEEEDDGGEDEDEGGENESEAIDCGLVDSDGSGKIDLPDFSNFISKWRKECIVI